MRRGKRSSAGGVPKWMITFADLMALLVVFFVMLYSMSVIDAEKFEVAAASVREAFGPMVLDAQTPTPPVLREADDAETQVDPLSEPIIDLRQQTDTARPRISEAQTRTYEALSAEIEDEDDITVLEGDDQILIRFQERAAFGSGSAQLQDDLLPILERIGGILAETSGRIRISGHTDDIPVRGGNHESNWVLSAARATSVLHVLEQVEGIDAARLVAQGHAHTRPLVDNTNAENRARNRRVEILLTDFSVVDGEWGVPIPEMPDG